MDAMSYWQERHGLRYYQTIKRWLDDLSPGELLIDVGGRDTPIATWGTFRRRVCVEIAPVLQPRPGVDYQLADWLECRPAEADVITCCQVLEHLDDSTVGPFARKLLAYSRHAIVSVPYRWAKGSCIGHKQDPVDLRTLCGWARCEPIKHVIVRDGRPRLVALFRGAVGARGGA